MSRATSAPARAAAVFVDPRAPQFAQARAHRTYEALIAAASAAFAADGYDATGTPDIARRARVSVGTFYRYFDDKRQVFIEVSRRHLAAGYERIMEGLTPERFVGKARRATIALTVDVLCAHVAQFPAMQRVFVEMSLRDPEVAALRRAFDDLGRERLTALITSITPRSRVPDPAATAVVLYIAAVETAAALAGLHGPVAVPAADAKAALVTVLDRALFSEPPP
ncbi:MAG: helix-turn-helix transcriptional regulator [Myxococcales bacterium]|nr:helix-turn-helix transcriptional regulator [Myxococcales bacterium]